MRQTHNRIPPPEGPGFKNVEVRGLGTWSLIQPNVLTVAILGPTLTRVFMFCLSSRRKILLKNVRSGNGRKNRKPATSTGKMCSSISKRYKPPLLRHVAAKCSVDCCGTSEQLESCGKRLFCTFVGRVENCARGADKAKGSVAAPDGPVRETKDPAAAHTTAASDGEATPAPHARGSHRSRDRGDAGHPQTITKKRVGIQI